MWGRWARFLAEKPVLLWRSTQPAPEDVEELGENAKRLLDDPVLHLALDRVERKLFEHWTLTEPAESETREQLFAAYWGLVRFRLELQLMLGNRTVRNRQQ